MAWSLPRQDINLTHFTWQPARFRATCCGVCWNPKRGRFNQPVMICASCLSQEDAQSRAARKQDMSGTIQPRCRGARVGTEGALAAEHGLTGRRWRAVPAEVR